MLAGKHPPVFSLRHLDASHLVRSTWRKGSISSVLVNDKEMLPSAFYSSDHMNPPNYPQCQLWTDAFSPYETVVPGVGGDKIYILDIAQRNYIETKLTFAWMGPRPIVPNVCSSLLF